MLENSIHNSTRNIKNNSFYSENNYIHHENSELNNIYLNSSCQNNQYSISCEKEDLHQSIITAENAIGISLDELKENIHNYEYEELLEKTSYLIEYTSDIVKISENLKKNNYDFKNKYNDLNCKYKETIFMLKSSEHSNNTKDYQIKELLKQIESINEKNSCLINIINENKQDEIETRNDTYKIMTTEETERISLDQSQVFKDKLANITINTQADLNKSKEEYIDSNKKSILKKKNKLKRNKSIFSNIKMKSSRGKSLVLLNHKINSTAETHVNIDKKQIDLFQIELTNELSFKKNYNSSKNDSAYMIDYFKTAEKPKTTKNKRDFCLDFSKCSITLDQVSEFPEFNVNTDLFDIENENKNKLKPMQQTGKFQDINGDEFFKNQKQLNINLDDICSNNIFESFKNPINSNIITLKNSDKKPKKLEKRYTLKDLKLLSFDNITPKKSFSDDKISKNDENCLVKKDESAKIKDDDDIKYFNQTYNGNEYYTIIQVENFDLLPLKIKSNIYEISGNIKLSFISNNKSPLNHDYLKEAKNVYMKYFKKTNIIDKKTLL